MTGEAGRAPLNRFGGAIVVSVEDDGDRGIRLCLSRPDQTQASRGTFFVVPMELAAFEIVLERLEEWNAAHGAAA
jgi:hypothetical protein